MSFSYDPLSPFDRLLGEALLGGPSRSPWGRGSGAAVQPMPLDVYATGDAAVVLAAVPGMRPEDLEVEVHQNTVTLSGRVHDPADAEEAKGATWYVRELWSGQYRRSVTLPFEIDAGKAEASFEGGIVRVVLPKAERAKPHRIALRQGGGERPQAIEVGEASQRQGGQGGPGAAS